MAKPLTSGIPYYGGKARFAGWIVERTTYRTAYVEPCGGVGSVLLRRRKSKAEILNDLSGVVVNWWEVCRDAWPELKDMLEWTPPSRDVRNQAQAICFEGDENPVRWAWAFSVLAQQSMANNMTTTNSWRYHFEHDRHYRGGNLAQIAERIKDLQLDNRDMCDVLTATQRVSDIMVYVDPPYPTAITEAYFETDASFDRAAVAELLLAQCGDVAVSGYEGDWPELTEAGWDLHTLDVQLAASRHNLSDRRTECLWTNYTAAQAALF